VRFATEDVDLAIRYGTGPWPGVVSRPLFQLRVAAVAASGYGPRVGQRTEHWISNGAARVLIDPLHDHWTTWCVQHRIERAHIESRLLVLDDMNVLLGAARAGQGIALVPLFLVLQDLREGKLRMLDWEALHLDGGYWLVHPPEEGRKIVGDVMSWLEAQAELTERELTELLESPRVAPIGRLPTTMGSSSARDFRTP
jgi:LysR family glycine cleavage system transcriptional activator